MANVILSTLTNTALGTEMGSIEFGYTAGIGVGIQLEIGIRSWEVGGCDGLLYQNERYNIPSIEFMKRQLPHTI